MSEKIGMYTEDEIFEYMAGGNGVRFLGRSMYDAIFDKIHALITEKEQLQQENNQLKEVIEEVRKKLKLERKVALSLNHPYMVSNIDEVLQILDKVKEEK